MESWQEARDGSEEEVAPPGAQPTFGMSAHNVGADLHLPVGPFASTAP